MRNALCFNVITDQNLLVIFVNVCEREPDSILSVHDSNSKTSRLFNSYVPQRSVQGVGLPHCVAITVTCSLFTCPKRAVLFVDLRKKRDFSCSI